MEYVDFSAFRTVLEYSLLKARIDYSNVPLQIMMLESNHFKNEIAKLNSQSDK